VALTVGLLMCGHVHPDALDLGGDYPELFTALLGPLGIDVVPYAAEDGQLPDTVDECDGWITSPSRCSVLDDLPWIHRLSDFVMEAVVRERPFVGICFGHQMLATLFGGRVQRADGGWGVGVKEYEIVEQRPWMSPPRDRIALVASHEDQVTALPDDAVLLARSDYCPIAAFELGPRCITLQPHIEFSTQISDRLLDLRHDLIGADVVAAARATLGRMPDRALVAGWFAEFLGS
jgi:GMP synthase-like glutamine amidotransferase